jgi:hypothetical protein
MNEAHEIKFRILAAMTAIEREIGDQLGLGFGHDQHRKAMTAARARAEA